METRDIQLCSALYPIISTSPGTVNIVANASVKFEEITYDCLKMLTLDSNFALTIGSTPGSKSILKEKKLFFLIVRSAEGAYKIMEKISQSQFNVNSYCLILLEHSTEQQNFDQLFARLWKLSIHNVNVLTLNEIDNVMKMFTFFPFTQENCHHSSTIEINEFIDGAWTNGEMFPSKLNDFHECPIVAAIFVYGAAAQKVILPDGRLTYEGCDVEIMKGLGDALNMNLVFDLVTEEYGWGVIFENGTCTGALRMLHENLADIAGNFYYLTELRSSMFQYTDTYFSLDLYLLIPRRPYLTALQKLMRPFETPVWILLSVITFAGFIAVFIIKKQSRAIQLLFLDRNINAPVLQMLVVLFGSSQHVLPKNDFSRMLLMSFVMFTLVLRSVYQGSLYKFLQSDGRKKDFETIDELIENDFTFYMEPTVEHMMKHQKFYDRRIIVNYELFNHIFENILDPSFKGVTISSTDEVLYLNKLHHKNFTYKVLNEKILNVPTVFYLKKNSYLTEVINEKINIFKSTGLIDYWIKKYLDPKYFNVKEPEKGPTKLVLKELLGAFQVYAVGILFSMLAYIYELIKFRSN